MKRTLLAIAIGAISAGLAGGSLAQDGENEPGDEVSVSEQALPDEGDTVEDYQEVGDAQEGGSDNPANGDQAPSAERAAEIANEDMQTDPGEQATSNEPPAEQAGQDLQEGFGEKGPTDVSLDPSIASMKVSEIVGMSIVNREGEALGEVEKVRRHNTVKDLHAIVSNNGFWIFGGSEVALPLADMQRQGDRLVLLESIGKEKLGDPATRYDEERYSAVDEDMALSEAMGR